ncbi:aldo/keto reductase [Propionibacteriaceae bacterium Y2011]|uniref:aldo/keto reductase n=1 Tax=Microlunatus sp. Y2014 TaxID=3418488 RepID=UPI003B457E97
METRRLGRTGHQTSVLVLGAAAFASVDQATADRSIRYALDAGINHIDTAADYGDAELRLGPWMPQIRKDVFLATKTLQRTAEAAWVEINASLERLQTDHLDLIQIHSVNDLDTLDTVFAKGGVVEAVTRAKDEGIASWVGITGHTEMAPVVHAEALRRHDFDSVLTPLNPRLHRDPEFADNYAALVELITGRDVALRVIKAAARRPWHDGEREGSTWYKPFTEHRFLTAVLAWLLDGHPEVHGLATAGEVSLLEPLVTAERARHAITPEQAEDLLAEVADYASPFVRR